MMTRLGRHLAKYPEAYLYLFHKAGYTSLLNRISSTEQYCKFSVTSFGVGGGGLFTTGYKGH